MINLKNISEVPDNTWFRIFTRTGYPLGVRGLSKNKTPCKGYTVYMKTSSGKWLRSYENSVKMYQCRSFCGLYDRPVIERIGIDSPDIYWSEDYAGY